MEIHKEISNLLCEHIDWQKAFEDPYDAIEIHDLFVGEVFAMINRKSSKKEILEYISACQFQNVSIYMDRRNINETANTIIRLIDEVYE